MRVENEPVIALNEKCVLDEKCENTEYGQSEADVNGVCVMPVVSSAKPTSLV